MSKEGADMELYEGFRSNLMMKDLQNSIDEDEENGKANTGF